MHRLVIAVAAVFLIATSTATGQTNKIDYGKSADKILAEGKVLYMDVLQGNIVDIQMFRFVVAYAGKIFDCKHWWEGPVECAAQYGYPAWINITDKPK